MSEQVEVKTPTAGDQSVEAKINDVVSKLEKNEFSIYFYAPSMNSASGGVGVLFKQAAILKEAGYNVKVIFEPKTNDRASYDASMKAKKRIYVYDKFDPTWLDFDISDLEILPQVGADEAGNPVTKIQFIDEEGNMSEQDVKSININTEDMVIIPEGFPNIMQQLAGSPCKKIVLAQSWIYILNSLQPGQTWQSYGIKDVISVSDAITEYIHSVMPGLDVKQYSQSINRELFNTPEKMSDKAPMVAFSCSRGPENRMKTYNVIRNFQQWYPKNKFVRFMELGGLSREEYAERLKSCSIALYTDEIAGFGTAPLEAMACGTHVVGWTPHGGKEYIGENGFWATNGDIFHLAEYLGIAVEKLLNGELDNPELAKSYEETLSRYTVEKEQESVLNIYKKYVEERIDEIKGIQTK
jgi:hypothetical protein